MKYWIIRVPFLNVSGMALFPFILIKEKRRPVNALLLNHELIHLRQQLELLIFPFYILYLLNYLINLIRYRNHQRAYYNIIFEREAYRMETDLGYLRRRRLWAWIQF